MGLGEITLRAEQQKGTGRLLAGEAYMQDAAAHCLILPARCRSEASRTNIQNCSRRSVHTLTLVTTSPSLTSGCTLPTSLAPIMT
jgi:hypothetical protein